MKIDDLLKTTGEWLKGTGPDSGIVISSRIRLARNIQGFNFFDWSDDESKANVKRLCKEKIGSLNFMKKSLYVEMDEISPLDRQFLFERHLVSREHIKNPKNKALFISEDEIISIMINEEDHLRIQVLQSGMNIGTCWDILKSLDNELEKNLSFSYSDKLGYLTACPTNVGTGMRASVMLHLPALVMTQQINSVAEGVLKLGLTIRGLFGEGTYASGNFFQVSNQVTLGHDENTIMSSLQRIITQIISHENSSRRFIMEKKKEFLEDRISRAYANLKSAHIINSEETLELLSILRMSKEMGFTKNITNAEINELFILIQPAHLQKIKGKELTIEERDIERAKLIKQKLK